MILRKPYAFFIKYFRIINLIMAILMAILIYQTTILGSFLNSYVKDYTVANNFVLSNYINFYSYIFCLIIIVLTIIVLSVMFIKQKPKKLYLLNLLISIIVIVLYSVDYNILKDITNGVLDIRVSKAIRDVTFIVLGLQIISFIITLIRAVGFDLKSFEFKKDLQELEIDIKDNEEFEVALELDKNKARRDVRNKIRHFVYFYKEKKLIITIVVALLLVTAGFILLINKTMYNTYYNENKIFAASNLQFNVINFYITNKDQTNQNVVIDDKMLAVIIIDIKNISADENKTLNTGLVTLRCGAKSYGVDEQYAPYVDDLGEIYENQKLSNDFTRYALLFKIDKEDAKKEFALKINDDVSYINGEIGAKNIFVKLKPIFLNSSSLANEYTLNETAVFSESTIGDSTFTINKYEINDKFKLSYDFCAKKDRCYKSYEYITPTATGNYFKTLLKLEGTFEKNTTYNIEEINDIYTFLNKFATICYEIDGEVYEDELNTKRIKPQIATIENTVFIEIDRKIKNANTIYLKFNIRNSVYKYTLK